MQKPQPNFTRATLWLLTSLALASCGAPEDNEASGPPVCLGSDCVDASSSCELAPQLYINELMVKNETGLTDESGKAEDWIEIYNASDEALDLGDMFISDRPEDPTRFQIPSTSPEATTIAAGGFLLLWADKDANEGPLHLGIKLSADGESVSIFDTDGETLIDQVEFGAQHEDISLGRYPDGCASWTHFAPPTPESSNL